MKNNLLYLNSWKVLTGFVLAFMVLSCSPEKKAQKAFKLGEYQAVIDRYEDILKKNPSNPAANYYIAEAYRKSNRPHMAEPYYEKAIRNGLKGDSVLVPYAYALKSNGKYEEARTQIESALGSSSSDYWSKRAEEEDASLVMLQDIKEKENYYKVKNLEAINTPSTEYSPVYNDGYLYFTSNRQNDKIYEATGTGYTNLYRVKTQAANVEMSTLQPLSEAINTTNINEGTITFTPNGRTMVFARGNGKKRNSTYDVDLWMSRERTGNWTAPVMINNAVNDPESWESSPAFSRDGRTMYFASDREGGYGGVDIYYARMNNRGRFTQAKNLGPEINTAGNDMFPYVSDDGNLYFASDGHPGFGGLDLFVAKRRNGRMEVENLGNPMNSPADDFGIYFFKADRGFFSSNREGGMGDDDIYTFRNEDPNLKIVNYYLAGRTMTRNEEDELEVLTNTKVYLLDYNDEILDETTTAADGKFVFRVYEHEHYSLLGEKKSKSENYLTTRVPFTTVGRAVDRETLTELVTDITYDTLVVLEKEEKNKVFVLENIYYDLDRWEIRSDAALELDKLVVLLKDNPEIKIELSSHTDSRQTDAYNNRLSDRRARSAVSYLIEQGIAADRLVARGYGESKPFTIKDESGNDVILTERYIEGFDNEERREELHQMNRRTEFKILEISSQNTEFSEDKYFDNGN